MLKAANCSIRYLDSIPQFLLNAGAAIVELKFI